MNRKISIILIVLMLAMMSMVGFVFAEDAQTGQTGEGSTPAVEEPVSPPKQLTITYAPSTMNVGDEDQISYELKYQDPGDDSVSFESTNPEVVLVDGSGHVVAVGPGTVEIIARAGDITTSALIKVNDIVATNISIEINEITKKKNQTEFNIDVGDVLHLSALIEPEGSKVGKIVWDVSNPEIATLGSDGEFIALKKGTTDVTVTADELTTTVTFVIGESGIALATIIKFLIGGIVGIAAIVVIIVLAVKNSRMKKAKQNRENKKKNHEDALRREIQSEANPSAAMDTDTKIYGSAVGARNTDHEELDSEEPFSIDDIK